MRILYISYNGALEPLGQSQVLAYLRELTRHGLEFNLLTFEKRARRVIVENYTWKKIVKCVERVCQQVSTKDRR